MTSVLGRLILILLIASSVHAAAAKAAAAHEAAAGSEQTARGTAAHEAAAAKAAAVRTAEPSTAGRSENQNAFADTVFWAPEILVEAERLRPSEELFNRSGFVALIRLDQMHKRMEDASTLLSRIAGIRVLQYGGLGSFATVSIRGSSSNQVSVYLDGVPLNNAYLGVANLSDLPLGDLHRIEIYRGFSPPHLGSSAIGGAINLVSFSGDDDRGPGASISVSAGSFGTIRYLLSLRSGAWRARFRGHAAHTRSRGDFAFIDDRSTPLNVLDDRVVTRLNNDFTTWNFIGRAEIDLPGFSAASVSHDAVLREGGVPGLGSNQSLTARSERNTHITYLKVEPRPLLSRRIQSNATAYHSWTADRLRDPDGDITPARQETDNRVVVHGANARLRFFPIRLPLSFELFFEGRRERFHPISLFPVPTEGPDRLRSTRTLSLSTDLRPAGDALVVTAGWRFERHSDEFYDDPPFPWLPPTPTGEVRDSEATPYTGFRWHVRPWLCIKGNWGRYYRIPTFLELFGNLGSVTGNPDLGPERGTNMDIGVVLRADRLFFLESPFAELVYLDNDIENLILFFPNSQYTSFPVNIGSASIRGLEASFSASVGRPLRLNGSYTLLEGRDTGPIPYYNGNRLAGRPAHQAAAGIEIVHTHWKAGYELNFIGSNYLDQANMKVVPSREIHNVLIELSLPAYRLSLSFEGRNLGNDQISDVNGFPLPGRSLYTTLSVTM
jgi:iron complex outermembrane receptor protein